MQFTIPRKQIPGLNQIHTASKNKTCINFVLNSNSCLSYIILSNNIHDKYLRLVMSGRSVYKGGKGLTLIGLYSRVLAVFLSFF